MASDDGLDETGLSLSSRLGREAKRLLPSLTADRQEDLAQTAAARIWPRIEQGEVSAVPPSYYLRRVLFHCFVDEHRRPRTRREVAVEDGVPEGPSAEADPETRAMSQEIRDAYRECLEVLPPGRRDAVPLRLLGHSYQEVADLLGCDVKAADNWINRGLSDLRRCLRSKGFQP